jgi:hypothetical protein
LKLETTFFNLKLETNNYNIPFVEGKIIFSVSRFTATFIALAKALKIASIFFIMISHTLVLLLARSGRLNSSIAQQTAKPAAA